MKKVWLESPEQGRGQTLSEQLGGGGSSVVQPLLTSTHETLAVPPRTRGTSFYSF